MADEQSELLDDDAIESGKALAGLFDEDNGYDDAEAESIT